MKPFNNLDRAVLIGLFLIAVSAVLFGTVAWSIFGAEAPATQLNANESDNDTTNVTAEAINTTDVIANDTIMNENDTIAATPTLMPYQQQQYQWAPTPTQTPVVPTPTPLPTVTPVPSVTPTPTPAPTATPTPSPSVTAKVLGQVTVDGAPTDGVQVAIGDKTTTTASSNGMTGCYAVDVPCGKDLPFTATYNGHTYTDTLTAIPNGTQYSQIPTVNIVTNGTVSPTPTPVPTAEPNATATPTPSPSPSPTPSPTPTPSPSPSPTPTPTVEPSATPKNS